MLIEQIIEFEWRGPGPLNRTCTPITANFYNETKLSKKNLLVDYFFPLKYCSRQCALLHPT